VIGGTFVVAEAEDRRIYLGGLQRSTTSESLIAALSKHCAVESAIVIVVRQRDDFTYAIVTCATERNRVIALINSLPVGAITPDVKPHAKVYRERLRVPAAALREKTKPAPSAPVAPRKAIAAPASSTSSSTSAEADRAPEATSATATRTSTTASTADNGTGTSRGTSSESTISASATSVAPSGTLELTFSVEVTFTGVLSLVETEQQLRHAVDVLSCERVIGFDTERRPSFAKGSTPNLPATLQLATRHIVFVFRLKAFFGASAAAIAPLAALLGSTRTLKAGVGIDDDVHGLCARFAALKPAGFVRLEELAHRARLQQKGLAALATALLGITMAKSKKVQLSDWEDERLSTEQLVYAATDAW
jgi:hypothetical protein